MPSTPFMGVRISWLTFARKCDLRSEASRASSRARLSSACASSRTPTSDEMPMMAIICPDSSNTGASMTSATKVEPSSRPSTMMPVEGSPRESRAMIPAAAAASVVDPAADSLLDRVSVHRHGGTVPTRDPARRRGADDGVAREVHQDPEPARRLLGDPWLRRGIGRARSPVPRGKDQRFRHQGSSCECRSETRVTREESLSPPVRYPQSREKSVPAPNSFQKPSSRMAAITSPRCQRRFTISP